jgi:hypothetical protein
MPPKTPNELREQIEQQNEQPAGEGRERTAEGLEVDTPSRKEFFSKLGRIAEPEKK